MIYITPVSEVKKDFMLRKKIGLIYLEFYLSYQTNQL